MVEDRNSPIGLFYSYSHKDERLRDKLDKHLAPLRREGIIELWHDRKIGPGKDFDGEINKHLQKDEVILLLVSPDFVDSDYCYGIEVVRAMERHRTGEARVIPVILRPVDWHQTPFGKLLALPTDGKPVTKWANQDEGFLNIARGIRLAASEFSKTECRRDNQIVLKINQAVYTEQFNGVSIVGEIHNLTMAEDQVVDWFLNLPEVGVTLQGQPGRPNLLPGAPWWPTTPFDLVARKMTRGAVFFPGEISWRSAFPREPLRGRLIARLFLGQQIEQDIEIYSIRTLMGRTEPSVTMPSIRLKHEQPANDRDFEILCLRLLRKHWSCPTLELYGRKGERQHGVDILDTGGGETLRAAQCKLRDRTKAISSVDIRLEIDKAKGFRPTLGIYLIMTTAKVSAAAQEEVIRINQEHRAAGLFEVRLMPWDAIEVLLDENPEILSVTYGSPTEASAGRFSPPNASPGAVLDPAVQPPPRNSLDAEIEEARGYLLSRDYQLARLLLQRLRRQKWDNLSERQKFRVVSNIAAAHQAEGNPKDAIPMFLEAKTYQPEEERAWSNEVLAYILAGNIGLASSIATEARKKFPHSGMILAHWLRTAPSDTSLEDLRKQIPSTLESDPDVCLALAEKAVVSLEFDYAEKLAGVAAERRPEWPHARIIGAQATLRSELTKGQWDGELPRVCDMRRLRFAEASLSIAIEQAKSDHTLEATAEGLLLRAEIRRVLGDSDDADSDVKAASQVLPNDPSVLRDHARLLLANGDRQGALSDLRQALQVSGGREDVAVLLATTLRSGGDLVERQEAGRLLMKVAELGHLQPEGFREHVIWAVLETLGEDAGAVQSGEFVSRLPKMAVSAMAMATFRAKNSLLQENREEAIRHADEAMGLLNDSSKSEDIRILGLLLAELGRHKDALPVWQRIASRTSLTSDTRRLIDCAARLKRHDVILDVCRALRSSGFEDESLLSHEASILQTYDPDGAVAILDQYLTRHPNANLIRLQRSALGLQLGRKDLVDARTDMAPQPEEIPSGNWPLAVRVMVEGGNADGALKYAYQLLREHFSEPDAHRAYLAAFLPLQNRPDIPSFEEARPGAAICFVETGTEQEQWRIIEDINKPDERMNEIGPAHFLSKELDGKRIGDSFALAASDVSSRTATIKQILSKYVYRYQDCLSFWQVRFPRVPGVEMVRVFPIGAGPDTKDLDLSPILSMLDRREEATGRLLDAYASQPVSLHILGTSVGQNAFEVICHLSGRPGFRIKCCFGSPHERSEALAGLQVAKGVVLDLTAIATISILNALAILENSSTTLFVSRGTMLELERLIIDESEQPEERGILGKRDGRYFLVEQTEDERQNRIRQLREVTEALKKFCLIVVCPGLAALEPNKREILVKAFGQHGAESIVLAAEPGRILWTDDLVLAGLAQKEFGARRIWTQVYFQSLADAGAADVQVFLDASARLSGYGYYFTSLNIASLMAAHSLANGDPKRWPLNQVLESFEDEGISPRDSLSLLAQYIARIFEEGIISYQDQILMNVLEHLDKRVSGIALVQAMQQILPRLMGLNVLGAERVAVLIRSWLARRKENVAPTVSL